LPSPTSFTPQENGDHVYTTNTAFETTKLGTWRIEATSGFVGPLGGSGIVAQATSAGASLTPVIRAASTIDIGPMTNRQSVQCRCHKLNRHRHPADLHLPRHDVGRAQP
jgi:hypothetical protein